MGVGFRRAVNATRATRGLAPLPVFKIYHSATVRPFSATNEGEEARKEQAILNAIEIRKERGGRVVVVDSKTNLTVWTLGEPAADGP